TQGRLADAARRLKRALTPVTDPRVRMRVGLDLARTLLRVGEQEQAKLELLVALKGDSRSRAALAAAHLLRQSFSDLEPSEQLLCLGVIAANESDVARRHEAAAGLLELSGSAGVSLSDEQKKNAYLALLDSERALDRLDELQTLCESTGDDLGLSRVLDRKADLVENQEEAASFAFRAAELFEASSEEPAAQLQRWRRYVERFPTGPQGAARLADLLEKAGQVTEVVQLLQSSADLFESEAASEFLARAGTLQLTVVA